MFISVTNTGSPRSLVMLAPAGATGGRGFRNTSRDYSSYRDLQGEMQKLRGRLYLDDGAIAKAELARDGRHILDTDEPSWHLLTLDRKGGVVGCIRFLQHSRGARFDDLNVREAALAESDQWGARLRSAVEDELAQARQHGFSFVEVGGWAMAPEIRGTVECLRSLLATYAWSRTIGGALGLCTATERNGSAAILRKIGGRSIRWDGAALPAYFDPRFNCRMHMLSFDSRAPNAKYESAIDDIGKGLLNIPVVCPEKTTWQTIVHGFSPVATAPLIANQPRVIPTQPVAQIA